MEAVKNNCSDCLIRAKAMDSLSRVELDHLSDSCHEIKINAGEIILKEQAPGRHVAFLRKGLAKIHKRGPRGKDEILKLVLPGYFIGIQTLLTQKNHLYSATALEDSSVCFIDFNFFKKMLYANAQFAYDLIMYISNDELNYFERMLNHNQKQVNGRLADTLLYLADEVYHSDSFSLPLSRKDLAALICSSRETVSRALVDLQNSNVLKLENKNIKIISKKMLKKISVNG